VVSSPEEAVSARESREKPSIEAGWRARNWSWVRNWSCYERGRALVGVTDVLVLLSWVMVLIECSGWRIPASMSIYRRMASRGSSGSDDSVAIVLISLWARSRRLSNAFVANARDL
jgi:hypothetical protein